MAYTTEIEVRFSDIDAYGHVNNALFFTYFETARFKFFKEHLFDSKDDKMLFLIAKAECEYKKPIDLSDKVFITVKIGNMGKSSFVLHYNLHNEEKGTFATGKTTIVCYNSKTQKTEKIPDSVLKLAESS